jgi:hypothetical protein
MKIIITSFIQFFFIIFSATAIGQDFKKSIQFGDKKLSIERNEGTIILKKEKCVKSTEKTDEADDEENTDEDNNKKSKCQDDTPY